MLVHLVLAGSRLLAGTNTLVVGLIVHPSRFTTASGVGVTIVKAQPPWIVVVGSPMSLHPIDLSLSSKDRDTLGTSGEIGRGKGEGRAEPDDGRPPGPTPRRRPGGGEKEENLENIALNSHAL